MDIRTTHSNTPPNSPDLFMMETCRKVLNFNAIHSYYREMLFYIIRTLPVNVPNQDEEIKIYILFRQTDEMKRIIKKIEGLIIMYNLNI